MGHPSGKHNIKAMLVGHNKNRSVPHVNLRDTYVTRGVMFVAVTAQQTMQA